MNSVNLVDYVVIGLYALLMVLVGLYVMRFNRGARNISAEEAGCPGSSPA